MPPEVWIAITIFMALALYAVTGGADFGGGVWDLLARGPRAAQQRDLIAKAIAPIWEANHVWLILVVVLLFVCFPAAFAAISTALHIPLTFMLIGIVLRGSAFVFRSYDRHDDRTQRRWGRLFAIASTVTPLALGVCVGAIAAGGIPADPMTGMVRVGFFTSWLRPFPFAIGAFTLALFAFLAAVYLTLETHDHELRELFRRRALLSAGVVGGLAALGLVLSREHARLMYQGLRLQWWSMPFQIFTGSVAFGVIVALWSRRFRLARSLAILQTTLILGGWALAQYPYIVEPDLMIFNVHAPERVLRAVLVALVAGGVVLVPALAYLFRVFKGSRAAAQRPQ